MPARICCTAADRSPSPPLACRHVNTDTTPSRRPLLEADPSHGRIAQVPPSSPLPSSTITRHLSGGGTKAKQQGLNPGLHSGLQKRLSKESTKSKRSAKLKRVRSTGKPIAGAASATKYALLSSEDDILLDAIYDGDATALSSKLVTLRSECGKDEVTNSDAQALCTSGTKAISKPDAIQRRKTLKRISLFQLVDWDRQDPNFERTTVSMTAAEEEPNSLAQDLHSRLSSSPPLRRKARSDSSLHASPVPRGASKPPKQLSSGPNVASVSHSLNADNDLPEEDNGPAHGKEAPSRAHEEGRPSRHQTSASASSVHLHTMRISQHLRSTSTFSALEAFEAHNVHHSSDFCGRQAPRSREQRQASSSGFASAKVPVTWGRVVRDGASSHYSSRGGSPPLLAVDSSLNLPSSTETLAPMWADADTYNLEPRDGSEAVESQQRPSTSYELARHRDVSSDNVSASTAGISSKFTEQFARSPMLVKDPSIVKHHRFNFLAYQKDAASARKEGYALYDGSADGPAALERKPSTEPGEQAKPDDAAALWEKALRAHRLEILEPIRSRSTGLLSLGARRPTSIRTKSRTNSLNSVLLQPASRPASKQRSLAGLNEEAYDDPVQRPMSAPLPKRAAVHARSRSSLQAWSRYPSHTRAERTGTAGLDDDVIGRDFANLHASSGDSSDMSDGGTVRRKKKKQKKKMKSKSMLFKEVLFKRWSRLYKSHSVHFPKLVHHTVAGHRSSLAVGGSLEYPELEIPPALSPFRMPETFATETRGSGHGSAVAERPSATEANKVVAGDHLGSATEAGLSSDEAQVSGPPRAAEALTKPSNTTPNSAAPAVSAQGDAANNTKNGFLCAPQPLPRDAPTLHETCIEFPFPKTTDPNNPPSSSTPQPPTNDGTSDSTNDPYLCAPQPLTRDASTIYESCVDLRFLRNTTEEDTIRPSSSSTPSTPDAMEAAQPTFPQLQQPRRLLASRSLPATLRQPVLARYDSASAVDVVDVPLLRNSTNDLCVFLQQCEIVEREKLVRAAEGAWGSGG